MRIAIVGSGIAGMTAAHLLHATHDVHLFESDERPGGHANTVLACVDDHEVAADTGFLVYNERTYPRFTNLLGQLGVATHPSDMSFSLTDLANGLEWRGTSFGTVFAQRRNVVRPAFLAMLGDVARFNRLVRRILSDPEPPSGSVADLLAGRQRWSKGFMDWYLVPLGSAIWSADPTTFTNIPARTFAEFFSRHGLLGPRNQPQWRTVTGGSQRYVNAILAPLRRRGRLHLATPVAKVLRAAGRVELLTATGPATFDHVVLAVHSDQALKLLADPSDEEQVTLGAIGYQNNRATLHTDTAMMPSNRKAWAAWNYVRPPGESRLPTVTYYLNRLQGFELQQPLFVTLNRDEEIDPQRVLRRFDYAHPVLDRGAVSAQARQLALSRNEVSFCGAYWGYGFHEDGVKSAVAVCSRFASSSL